MASLERSFLGEAATRLGRLFKLGGLLSPKYDEGEAIKAVVVLGDATLPGYGDRGGVRWSVGGVAAGGGVGAYAGIEAQEDVIVELVSFADNTAACQFTIKWNTATEASPSGAAFAGFVPALDRATSVNIAAPVTALYQGGAAPAAVTARTLWQGIAGLGVWQFPFPFLLTKGSRLWVEQSLVASTLYANFSGRSF